MYDFGLTRMNSKSPIFAAQSDVTRHLSMCASRGRHYFAQLQGEQPSQVYDMVSGRMEKPLFICGLRISRGNQTRAAEILGLNRGTLRKVKAHGLMSESLIKRSRPRGHFFCLILICSLPNR